MTRNHDITQATAAVAAGLAALPLDDLPEVVSLAIDCTYTAGTRGRAQLARGLNAPDDVLRAVLAWQAVLPAGHLITEENLAHPGTWYVAAVGLLGGFRTEVWNAVQLEGDPAEALRAIDNPAAAAALLVQLFVTEAPAEAPVDPAVARVQTALAAAGRAHSHGDGQWSVTLDDPRQLADWLAMVEAAAAAVDPATQRSTTLRLWTSQMDDRDPAEAEPLIYAELVSPCLGPGLGRVQVLAMLDMPTEDAVRAAHPELRRPRAELELDRGTWLRYLQSVLASAGTR